MCSERPSNLWSAAGVFGIELKGSSEMDNFVFVYGIPYRRRSLQLQPTHGAVPQASSTARLHQTQTGPRACIRYQNNFGHPFDCFCPSALTRIQIQMHVHRDAVHKWQPLCRCLWIRFTLFMQKRDLTTSGWASGVAILRRRATTATSTTTTSHRWTSSGRRSRR